MESDNLIKTKNKNGWTRRKSLITSLVIGFLGIITFGLSYLSWLSHSGLVALNRPALDLMISLRQPSLNSLMLIITKVGSSKFVIAMVILLIIIWCLALKETWRPFIFGITMALAGSLIFLLKTIFTNPRPSISLMVPPIETGWSFPSGHTIASLTLIFSIGYLLCSRNNRFINNLVWIITSILVGGGVAFSRIYLGYHWLNDVVASIGISLIILAALITLDNLLKEPVKKMINKFKARPSDTDQ